MNFNYETEHDKQRDKTESRLSWIWICFFVGMIAALMTLEASADGTWKNSDESYLEVEGYLTRWHRNVNNRRLRRALSYTSLIIDSTNRHDVDPLLVSTVISFESSWRPSARGKRGEVGLMQVMPDGLCAHNQDLSNPAGQIEAGVNCLSICKKKCGPDAKRILTLYGTGKNCTSKSQKTNNRVDLRVEHYRAAVRRHRKETMSHE